MNKSKGRHVMLALLFAITPWSWASTPTGIPLDSKWRQLTYEFAQKHVVHPSWGLAHSERAFQVTKSLAAKESITVDEDVLFAAAYLHDIGGLAPYAKKGVDHAQRSVEVAEPLLRDWGFPMEKWPTVKELILGHTYYGEKPKSEFARAFRDADILDFLGSIGVARLFAAAQEPAFNDGTLKPTAQTLKTFASTLKDKCSLQACHELARPRLKELQTFLSNLDGQTFEGLAL